MGTMEGEFRTGAVLDGASPRPWEKVGQTAEGRGDMYGAAEAYRQSWRILDSSHGAASTWRSLSTVDRRPSRGGHRVGAPLPSEQELAAGGARALKDAIQAAPR